MAFEIFTVALNASGSPSLSPTQSSSFDFLALGAIVISLSTLGFTVWNASRTRKSEQLKIAREHILSIDGCRKAIDALYIKNRASQPADDEDLELEALAWSRSIEDLINEIFDFKLFVSIHGIEDESFILRYKRRLHSLLGFVEYYRVKMNLEEHRITPKKEFDSVINKLLDWCAEGNEDLKNLRVPRFRSIK